MKMNFKKENILIVDDDIHVLELLKRHLQSMQYYTFKAVSVKEALSILKSNRIDLLITDIKMPDVDGFELMKYVSEHYPSMPILVISGYVSAKEALEMGKSGVIDYLVKPFTKDELQASVSKSLSGPRQQHPRELATTAYNFRELVGNSPALNQIKEIIHRVKDIKATVLIQGESGTGKELIARAIHYNGKFSRKPFIAVNCGAIPEDLLEAELFGYEKGAFTGANDTREGFFQAAEGGTIFLDEIGNASPKVQNSLLRVLQEKEVQKVGSQKSTKIDIRVIAATNSNLANAIKQGKFRQDLYYRLSVVEILAPPLRERVEDIAPLAKLFLQKYAMEYKDRSMTIGLDTLEILERYNWPGNIRELENCIQRAVIMSDGEIGPNQLPDMFKFQINFPKDGLKSLAEKEKEYIQQVLELVKNNKTRAAEILGIDRKTLRAKVG